MQAAHTHLSFCLTGTQRRCWASQASTFSKSLVLAFDLQQGVSEYVKEHKMSTMNINSQQRGHWTRERRHVDSPRC